MRPEYFAPVIFLGLFVAGCGTPGDTGKPPATPVSATSSNGVLRGQVMRPPGTDPRSGTAPTSPVPVNGDPIRARDSTGHLVATTVTGPAGHFELTLPPGTYQLSEDTCHTNRKLNINAGATTPLTLLIPNNC